MPRLSMNELTTFRWSFDEDLTYYKQAGYQGIGLWLRKLEDFGVERGIEMLQESDLAVSNVMWAGGFTGSDGESVGSSLAEARRTLELAREVNAGCLTLYAGGRNRHTRRHARRLLTSALDDLLPFAELAEVPLAIEPMHPCYSNEWSFLDSLESTLEIIQSYRTPWLKLVYDTFHFPLSEAQDGLLEEMVPHLAVVHLSDRDRPHDLDQERCQLGMGSVPLEAIIHQLLSAGYEGFFDIEILGQSIETTCYHKLLHQSRQVFDQITTNASVVRSA